MDESILSGDIVADLAHWLLQQKIKHKLRTRKPYYGLETTNKYAVLVDDTGARFGCFLNSTTFKPVLTYGPRLTRSEYDNLKRILLALAHSSTPQQVPLWSQESNLDSPCQ